MFDHNYRGDTLTPSYPCYPNLLIRFSETLPESSCFDQPIFDEVLSPSGGAISELSLLDHYCRGDTLTPSFRGYPILLIWFSEAVLKIRVLGDFLLSAISELRSYLRAILVRSLLQR